jgi:hypothetical protein
MVNKEVKKDHDAIDDKKAKKRAKELQEDLLEEEEKKAESEKKLNKLPYSAYMILSGRYSIQIFVKLFSKLRLAVSNV